MRITPDFISSRIARKVTIICDFPGVFSRRAAKAKFFDLSHSSERIPSFLNSARQKIILFYTPLQFTEFASNGFIFISCLLKGLIISLRRSQRKWPVQKPVPVPSTADFESQYCSSRNGFFFAQKSSYRLVHRIRSLQLNWTYILYILYSSSCWTSSALGSFLLPSAFTFFRKKQPTFDIDQCG